MDEDDEEDFLPNPSRRAKKMVIDDEDFNPTTDGKSSVNNATTAQRKRKPLMVGSDESEAKYPSYNGDPSTGKKSESNYKVDFSYRIDKGESTDGKTSTVVGTTLRKRKNVNYKIDSTGTKEDEEEEYEDNEDDSEYDFEGAYKNLTKYFND
jgi:hypothetical protein